MIMLCSCMQLCELYAVVLSFYSNDDDPGDVGAGGLRYCVYAFRRKS